MFERIFFLLLASTLVLAFKPAFAQQDTGDVPPITADCRDDDGDGYGWSESAGVTCQVPGKAKAVFITWPANPIEEKVTHYEVAVRMSDDAAGVYRSLAEVQSTEYTTALRNIPAPSNSSFCIVVRALRKADGKETEYSKYSDEACVTVPDQTVNPAALSKPGLLSVTFIPEA